jgi:hypothetical protein
MICNDKMVLSGQQRGSAAGFCDLGDELDCPRGAESLLKS